MNQEHAFCLAIEKLLGHRSARAAAQLIRVLYCRDRPACSIHLLNVTTQAMDVGALTPPLWGFEEREKLMVFYERASGARMHADYFRPGGVHQDLPPQLIDDIETCCDRFPKSATTSKSLLTDNRIFKQRNVDIGVVQLADALAWGFSGVMLRGSGVAWDLRKASPTNAMTRWSSTFRSARTATATTVTCIRMEEMRQSVRIMKQCIEKLREPEGRAGHGRRPQGRAAARAPR